MRLLTGAVEMLWHAVNGAYLYVHLLFTAIPPSHDAQFNLLLQLGILHHT